MNLMKKNNGVTLIILVIGLIVLLVITGILVSKVTKDDSKTQLNIYKNVLDEFYAESSAEERNVISEIKGIKIPDYEDDYGE